MTHHPCDYCGGFDLNIPEYSKDGGKITNYVSLSVGFTIEATKEFHHRQVCVFCHFKIITGALWTPEKLDNYFGKKVTRNETIYKRRISSR